MHFTREQRDAWYAETKDSPFNLWLRGRVNRSDGTLDLQLLHEVAREHGIDPDAYIHLNPGQQRMTIGNRLRKLLPGSTYAKAGSPSASARTAPSIKPTPSHSTDFPHLRDTTVRSLLRMHGAIIEELRGRQIVRTGNSPLGDYAEYLFGRAFGWKLQANSAAGFDAIDDAGTRFQIKARRIRFGQPGERQLSVMRALPTAKFDTLAAVLLDEAYEVVRAALIPHATVLQRSSHIKHVNGWRFTLDDTVWNLPGVLDVTMPLKTAAEQL